MEVVTVDTTAKTYPQGITAEMVKKAVEKHGDKKVKLAELPLDDDNDDVLTVLVCRPSRTVMSEYQKWADKSPKKADDILVKACLLSHKDQVLADDDLFTAAVDAIAQLITVRKAVIKNL